jgi:hypothetical protein
MVAEQPMTFDCVAAIGHIIGLVAAMLAAPFDGHEEAIKHLDRAGEVFAGELRLRAARAASPSQGGTRDARRRFDVPFMDAYLAGEALLDEVDDWIEAWHESDGDGSLDAFLGFTSEEGAMFIETKSIHAIVAMRNDV